MINEQELYEAISKLLIGVVPVIILSGLMYTLIKTFILNLKDYIMLKWDSIGIGSKVLYKGEEAIVQNYDFRKITLHTKDKIMLINTQEWSKMAIIIPKNVSDDK